jgi:extradiol dioxygenase family protein
MAVKVRDVKRTAKFFEQAFGFRTFASYSQRDHLSVHLTDGEFDLAIIHFDNDTTGAARAAGSGPCIHHIGIDVARDEMVRYTDMIRDHDCEFISDPGAVTVKFRVPGGGSLAEISPFGWHFRTKG